MSDVAQPGLVVGEGLVPLKRRLRSYGRFIASLTLIGLLAGILVLIFVPAKFEAIAVAAPPIDRSGAKIRGDAPTTSSGGLLAGLAGAQATPPLLQRFEMTLHSRHLADELMKDDQLAHQIFAGQWDEQANKWREPTGVVSTLRRFVLGLLHRPTEFTPSGWSLQDYLKQRIVTTSLTRGTGFEIKYVCVDQAFCLQFLKTVVSKADALIRQDVIEHDRSYSSFISSRLQTVTDIVDRQVLTNLLSDIRRDEMLAESGQNYSMDLVDGPSVSALPTEPRIGITLALGTFAGLMLSTIIVLVYETLGVGAIVRQFRS